MRRFAISSLALVFLSSAAGAQAGGVCGNAGLKLAAGFCASIWADSLPAVRELAIAPNGDVFVGLQRNGGVVALRDASKSGKADRREHFATGFTSAHVALFDGHLYTEVTPQAPQRGRDNAPPAGPAPTISIVRYPLKAGELTPSGPPDTIVQGLPYGGSHNTRNFAITRDGVMYVNVGTATNSCQARDRAAGVPGSDPCTELDTRGGLWKFDARKSHQTPSAANHFARGIRNAVGIAINPADDKLWTTQHGRDQLYDFRTNLGLDSAAAQKYNAENPAEELMQVSQGEDYGWPYCYYAVSEKHLVLAPEYGGDGKKVDRCAQKKEPVATFPGHWAPNALMMYSGSNFPARYKGGAFIAFHGSWNRAPEPQAGYNVVFQPLDKNGKATGGYEVFADDFAPNIGTGRATMATGGHRPTGLAQGPDGALYVTDDVGGRIYRIVYGAK